MTDRAAGADADDAGLDELKRSTRRLARAARKSLPPGERLARSSSICAHIEASSEWIAAKVVTAFLPIQSEADLRPLLTNRLGFRIVGIPRTEDDAMSFDAIDLAEPNALVVGEFGIACARVRNPIDPAKVDLALVPLLAFDRRGNRLGAGRAFYDRWLPKAAHAFRLGIGFSVQEVDVVPVNRFDEKLHAVVTEHGIERFH